jgi:hypothetical protein
VELDYGEVGKEIVKAMKKRLEKGQQKKDKNSSANGGPFSLTSSLKLLYSDP